jgi:hypothetical protein
METNSFEQLCINYTNEALQAAFKKSTVLEQLKIYDAEKVKVPNLTVYVCCAQVVAGRGG